MSEPTLDRVKLPWRSAKRNPPREGQRVIVKMADGRIRDGYAYAEWVGGFCTGPNVGRALTDVTHWLPYR